MIRIDPAGNSHPSRFRRAGALLRRRARLVGSALLAVWVCLFVFHVTKPLPEGISVDGAMRAATDVELLLDLTYEGEEGPVVEQEIFDRILSMISEADEFVVLDMFLFDGEHGGEREYRTLSSDLTEGLVSRKRLVPELEAVFITDEINNFYGAYTSPEIARLRDEGVQVLTTRLSRLRDSNPSYSAGWRMLLGWFGSAGPGWLPHPLSSSGQKVTARSYLKLLNFKANHRKLIVTEKGCLVSSANPHDASGFHSNIAFATAGPVCGDILDAERAVASFSGGSMEDWPEHHFGSLGEGTPSEEGAVQLVTEGRILDALLEDLGTLGPGDSVDLAMFYLSHRRVVRALLEADERGARVRLVLDPNKDAFGRQKGGVPNRQVAWELVRKSHGRIDVRWYDTHGEQFHTKLVVVSRGDSVVVMGGSANLTRRNIGDFNLEADLRFALPETSPLSVVARDYFHRIFTNRDGDFTLPFEAYQDDSRMKTILYRLEEFTGLCSF